MTLPAKPRPKTISYDLSEYLFFSPNTTGLSGSPVKIRADLFMDFFCNVDPQTHDGQSVIRDIESLKIFGKTASQNPRVSVPARNQSEAHKSRLNRVNQTLNILSFNQSISPEKTFYTKNVRVFYRVLQMEGDSFPTVYISDIRVVRHGSGEPAGLYEYVSSQFNQKLAKAKNTNLEGKTVYISPAFDGAQKAMDEAAFKTGTTKSLLFFNPPSIAEDLGIWKPPRLSDTTKSAISELTNLLQENQKRKVSWFVEGEGAAVLARALAAVPGTLETHAFKFLNARTNLPSLLQALKEKKAKLEGEFLNYTGDRTALLSIAQNPEALYNQLKQLPAPKGYDCVTRRYLLDFFQALGENGNAKAILAKALSVKGSTGTFIDAITISRRSLK
jgi:hypothetical protein